MTLSQRPLPTLALCAVLLGACGADHSPTATTAGVATAPSSSSSAPDANASGAAPAAAVKRVGHREETPKNAKPGDLVQVREFYENGQLYWRQHFDTGAPESKGECEIDQLAGAWDSRLAGGGVAPAQNDLCAGKVWIQ